MAQSLKELCCCTAERPGIFQYIPPVASAMPVSIQLGQRLDSLQSSLYSAGVVSRLALLLLCQSDNIAQVGTFPGSPGTQKFHPILWPLGYLFAQNVKPGFRYQPCQFLGSIHPILNSPPKRLDILVSLNQWWVCISQNAQEACTVCGDRNIRAPGKK